MAQVADTCPALSCTAVSCHALHCTASLCTVLQAYGLELYNEELRDLSSHSAAAAAAAAAANSDDSSSSSSSVRISERPCGNGRCVPEVSSKQHCGRHKRTNRCSGYTNSTCCGDLGARQTGACPPCAAAAQCLEVVLVSGRSCFLEVAHFPRPGCDWVAPDCTQYGGAQSHTGQGTGATSYKQLLPDHLLEAKGQGPLWMPPAAALGTATHTRIAGPCGSCCHTARTVHTCCKRPKGAVP
jgi:hypothetical protein